MASNFYDSSDKFVDGSATPQAEDVNEINSAVDAGFQMVEAAMGQCSLIGVGQDWQNPIRSFNTIYQNQTNKPIQVIVTVASSPLGAGTLHFKVGALSSSSTILSSWVFPANANDSFSVSAIIPPGYYYRLVQVSGYATISRWAELR